jgi:O-antigen/teichoic acid export membrane protein
MTNIYRRLSLLTLAFRFAPALIIPAFLSIASIYFLTRLLEPAVLGQYNLTLTLLLVIQSILFFPLDMALSRFYAIKEMNNSAKALFKTVYEIVICINFALVVMISVIFFTVGRSHLDAMFGNMWILATPLLVLRTTLSASQSISRVSGRLLRYNMIECLCPTLGLLIGLLLIWQFHEDNGAITGLVIGLAVGAIIDIRTPLEIFLNRARFDRHMAAEVMQFVWPVMMAAAVSCTLQYADRFLVNEYSGAAAVAVYTVAFSLVDRPLSMICLVITAGAFQKAMDSYAVEGREAARKQLGYNGAILLAVAGPACLGLMLCSNLIASVMVGPSMQEGLAPLIQLMALTSLLRAMGLHYADHTFHIPNRPLTLFAIYAPIAIGNLILCFVFVPRYGMIAAAYCGLASQIWALASETVIAQKILPLWLPKWEVLRTSICLIVMYVVLRLFTFPGGWTGLFAEVSLGVLAYGLAAIATNLGGARLILLRKINIYLSKPSPV